MTTGTTIRSDFNSERDILPAHDRVSASASTWGTVAFGGATADHFTVAVVCTRAQG